MAANDIRVYRVAAGVSEKRAHMPMQVSASFREGEPLINASGYVTEAGDDPPAIIGIASMRAVDVAGTAFSTGVPITFVPVDSDQYFVCKNFATGGAGAAVTPTLANAVGQLAGLTLSSSNWVVDTGCANLILKIEAVLDASGHHLGHPNALGAGVAVVFRGV